MQDLIVLMFDRARGVKHSSSGQTLEEMKVVTVTATFEEELVFSDLGIQNILIHYRLIQESCREVRDWDLLKTESIKKIKSCLRAFVAEEVGK